MPDQNASFRSRYIAYATLPLILALFYFPVQITSFQDYTGLPPGPYCASRIGQCCPGRVDECSYPILGTLCYCDDFCNRTRDDCCPDYLTFCKGIAPPETTRRCFSKGVYYDQFQTVKDNCNTCKCTNVGERAELLCETNECLVDPELIAEVNRQNLGWEARKHDEFWARTLKEGIAKRLGTIQPDKLKLDNPLMKVYDPKRLPPAFDSLDKWRKYLTPVQDQQWCGSSWALSTTAVASDRLAIMSNGTQLAKFSPQHLISCSKRGQRGCDGGHVDRAWSFLNNRGVVSERCLPYIAEHGVCRKIRELQMSKEECMPKMKGQSSLYRTGPTYRLGNETDIMDEIIKSGPVQATMKVYQDFFSYHRGVYKHSMDAELRSSGYHSVRIIGWGVDHSIFPPQKYWKVANSWGPNWGEGGYFRILRGKNECDIESYVFGEWTQTYNSGSNKIMQV